MKNNSISQFKSFTQVISTKLAISSCMLTIIAAIAILLTTSPKETPLQNNLVADHFACDGPHHVGNDCLFHDLNPFQEQLMKQLLNQPTTPERPAVCWHPDTDEKTIADFHKKNNVQFPNSLTDDPNKYQISNRWSTTATNGGGLGQGDPTTLTWSFVPDGTTILGGCGVIGESTDPSDLIAFLDGVFGAGSGGTDLTQRPWFTYFQQVFDRWSELTGTTYVYEDNDDGAGYGGGGSAGVLNVRGDVRIGGHRLDGNSGVLACNYFPNNGDMIIDTDDSFYSPGNTLGFRNVLSHEHGHGLGFSHSCPVEQKKLMEPFVSTAFDGPQEDDIQAGNRSYGDRNENNNTSGTATPLGSVSNGNPVSDTGVSIDDVTENDFYSFSISATEDVSVTVTPTGTTYLAGPQNGDGSCSAGTSFNALVQSNLGVELIDSDGTTVLATENASAAGFEEIICNQSLTAGTYYVRVFGTTSVVQMYDVQIEVGTITCPTCTVIINEVDYDQDGTDDSEFIELYNPCGASINLSTYSIQLINGSGGTAYETFNLSGMLASGDYYVICANSANTPNCDLDVSPNTNLIQNGAPDAVALFDGATLVDALSYEGDVPGYVEGSGSGLTDNTDSDIGLSRYPNGSDTNVNNVDFSLRCITPGEENLVDNTFCGQTISCLSTLFTGGTISDGNMFDITNNGGSALTISSFEVNISSGTHTIEVYYTTSASTYVGNDMTPGAWTLLGSESVTSVSANSPTAVDISGLTLAPGESKGLYVTSTDGSIRYTSGTSTFNDGILFIDLDPGIGKWYPFAETFSPRQWNGTICYAGGSVSTAELSIAATSADKNEGNAGNTAFTFTVTRNGDVSGATMVDYAVTGSSGNPANAADFGGTFPSGTVSFAATETSQVITINVSGDTDVETDEEFTVTLSNPTGGANITTATAVGIIRNDDALPTTLSIAATSADKNEGNAGNTAFTFTVTRNGDVSGATMVDYAVTGSSGNPANAADFGGTLPSGTASFAATETSQVITINVSGDTDVETDEEFTVTLSNPTGGASITTGTAVGTIRNDDTVPCPTGTEVFINEFHYDNNSSDVNEFVEVAVLKTATVDLTNIRLSLYNGSGGVTYGTHLLNTFTLGSSDATYDYYSKAISGIQNGNPDGFSLACANPVTLIEFISYGGTFTATNGDASGQTSTDVAVTESGSSPIGSSIQKIGSSWFVTCGQNTQGNTNALPTTAIAATNTDQAEGNIGNTAFTFTVTRGGLTTGATTVDYAVTGSGANPANAADFGGAFPNSTISFAAGETSKILTINVSGDTDLEMDEEFTVTLSNTTGCSTNITTPTAIGTIQNDDCALLTWYRDFDNDTFGDINTTTQACTQPTGYVADNTDCDDNDEDEFPGQTWYIDADGDDYGASSTTDCERPTYGFLLSELSGDGTDDCNDGNAAINPGATEICDGTDNNCNGMTDEGVQNTYYADSDMDGFGDPNVSVLDCSAPTGYVADNTDCDDTDGDEFPGQTWYIDADGDDYGASSTTDCERPTYGFLLSELSGNGTDDCDDGNASINPGATEICDGNDNNCNGMTDEGVQNTYYADTDMDGFGDPNVSVLDCSPPSGFVADNTDCDDTDEDEFPGQTWYIDADGDDYGASSTTDCERPTYGFLLSELSGNGTDDCDDGNAAINPAATEICDGVDNNCNGMVDENGLTTYYADSDMDGFGDPNVSVLDCSPPSGYVLDNTDCDDTDGDEFPGQTWYIDADGDDYGASSTTACERPANGFLLTELSGDGTDDCNDGNADINPGATEICDGTDNNCNGMTDEGVQNTYYADSDMDGFGDPNVSQESCMQPSGYVLDNTDCDDTDGDEFPGQTWYIDADGDGYGASSTTACERPTYGFLLSELSGDGTDDCDDGDNTVYPNAPEICDGKDNDCDNMTDEDGLTTYYADTDMDGFGDPAVSQMACTQPAGYVLDNTDCDDTDEDEFPGQTWYIDADGDDYGASSTTSCERPTYGFLLSELSGDGTDDCDDGNAAINPGATEICDGTDNNCNGMVDENGLTIYYADSDMDGFGDPNVSQESCMQPSGYVLDNTDCDDTDGDEFPGQTWYIDADGDGYGASTTTACERPTDGFLLSELSGTGTDDCDDGNAAINPAATEICDGVDNNCNSMTDEGVQNTYYADTDMDGFGDPNAPQMACSQPSGFVADNTDCDDTDGDEFPGQTWYIDADGDDYGASTTTACERPAHGFLLSELSGDGTDDCNDGNAAINPGATEICDGTDNNCNGMVDENGLTTYYADSDMDGFGDPNVSQESCMQPSGYVLDNTDCDDTDGDEFPGQTWHIDADGDGYGASTTTDCERPAHGFLLSELSGDGTDDCNDGNAAINPAATEICDGVDNNCNSMTDEGVQNTYYADSDMDGFGDPNVSVLDCSPPSGYVADNTDCNDNNSGINPNADEVCDGVDNDCDGTTDQNPVSGPVWYEDSDMDGFGNTNSSIIACSQPSGYVNNDLDCNDMDGNVNPNASEVCNSIDDNCNGQTDEFAIDASTWYEDSDMDGFGNLNVIVVACTQPAGFVGNFTDCDDTDPNINPNTIWYVDFDGDGFGNPASPVTTCDPGFGYSLDNTDCNDNIAAINPNATELCNGVDDNCNNITDEGCSCTISNISVSNYSSCDDHGTMDPSDDTFSADVTVTFVNEPNTGTLDLSGDGTASVSAIGLGSSHTFIGVVMSADGTAISLTANFSDDPTCTLSNNAAGTAPSSCSTCSINISNVAVTHETCPGFSNGTINITATGSGQIAYSINGGATYNLSGSFANLSPATYNIKVWILGSPTCSATNVATINPAPPGSLKTWYKDIDGDGYSDGISQQSCAQPTGYYLAIDLIAPSGDCNDNDPSAYPGQVWYKDSDNDGYTTGATQTSCLRPTGYKTASELVNTTDIDCNDSNPAVNPGASELCNGIDDNCNGQIDEGAAGGLTWTGNVAFYTQAQVDAWSSCYSIINGNVTITGAGITHLDSLENISEITGNLTIQSTGLTTMVGLDTLEEVGGTLTIYFNSSLVNLEGLEDLNTVKGALYMYYNFQLSDCCAIEDLVSGGVTGPMVVFFNKVGCNSVPEIVNTCNLSPLVGNPNTRGDIASPHALEQTELFKDITLFPNPADEFVNILIFGKYQQGMLKVFDATGKVVMENKLAENNNGEKISIKNWRPGIYFVQVLLDGEIITKKLAVQ